MATPLLGDRAAWDAVGHPSKHSSDLPSGPVHHVPAGTSPGDTLSWDGDKWTLQAAAAPAPIMTLGTRDGVLAVAESPFKVYNQYGEDRTITKVFLSVGTAPVGADIICDVKVNGSSIFTTENRPKILDGQTTGFSTTIASPDWADGDYLTWEIAQIGSTTEGENLVIHIVHGA